MQYDLHLSLPALGWPHAAEVRNTFVCDKDRTHAEVLARDAVKEVWREHRRRQGEAFEEMSRRITHARAEKARQKRDTL